MHAQASNQHNIHGASRSFRPHAAQDEVNVTKYNVKKHGVAGSESCEACEVGSL